MPKKLKLKNQIDHVYAEKLAKIRQKNVERHSGYENTLKLRQNILKFQRNTQYNNELARLEAAIAQGYLGQHAHQRVENLKNLIVK